MKRIVNKQLAHKQWINLVKNINNNVSIDFINPQKDLVDMVFSANGALIYKNKAIISNFNAKPRINEAIHYKKYFYDNDYVVSCLPPNIKFEGAGDALFSHNKKKLWCAHGFRSDSLAYNFLKDIFIEDNIEIIQLKLVDPLFYHLDTCFCPLDNDTLMFYKEAFDIESLEKIYKHFDKSKLISVSTEDAKNFACNSIFLNPNSTLNVIGHKYSPELQELLTNKGYNVQENDMSEFLLAGGSTKCSVLDITP